MNVFEDLLIYVALKDNDSLKEEGKLEIDKEIKKKEELFEEIN